MTRIAFAILVLATAPVFSQEPQEQTAKSTDAAFGGFLGALLGGGAMGAIIAAASAWQKSRHDLRVAFLKEQVSKLYGPVLFHLNNSEEIRKHTNIISGLYQKVYCDTKWAENARDSVSEEATETIELENRFVAMWNDNNQKVVKIIEENFHLSEPDDQKPFGDLALSVLRLKIERDERQSTVPWRIATGMPRIRLYDLELTKHIQAKFDKKTAELRKHMETDFAPTP